MIAASKKELSVIAAIRDSIRAIKSYTQKPIFVVHISSVQHATIMDIKKKSEKHGIVYPIEFNGNTPSIDGVELVYDSRGE